MEKWIFKAIIQNISLKIVNRIMHSENNVIDYIWTKI